MPVTATIPTDPGCGLIFATNIDISLTVAYYEYGDGSSGGSSAPNSIHSYARANAQSTVVALIEGRTAPVAFRPAVEGNADVFQRTIIAAIDTPGNPLDALGPAILDRWAFDPLINLIENVNLPYITVCDSTGRTWVAFVEFIDGSYAWVAHEHQADVKVTQISLTPIPVAL